MVAIKDPRMQFVAQNARKRLNAAPSRRRVTFDAWVDRARDEAPSLS